MFLLTINFANLTEDTKELPDLPEVTLWNTFADAVEAAFKCAAECGAKWDMEEADIDFGKGMLFIPQFCEVMPITISTADHITWLGTERKTKEEREKLINEA